MIATESKYPPEIRALDEIFQKEETVQNELALEKAKLKYYRDQLRERPDDADLKRHVQYHESEVARLEALVRIA